MENSSFVGLGKIQRIFLLIISFVIALALLILRNGLDNEKPLDFLARNSLEPEIALQNGRPTIIEFYADWCEACQEMAPSIINIKSKFENKIDIVLLNVDNQKWLDLIQKYDVNGIPQLNLFDESGSLKGKSIGIKTVDEINQIVFSLLNQQSLPDIPGINNNETFNSSFSILNEESSSRVVNPRSHS